eukprot:SM000017S02877  [mRNA]  locus=s17:831399:832700:- [translate_table: standard]
MTTWRLAPVATALGSLSLSVAYRAAHVALTPQAQPTILPRLITNYVACPPKPQPPPQRTGSLPCNVPSARRAASSPMTLSPNDGPGPSSMPQLSRQASAGRSSPRSYSPRAGAFPLPSTSPTAAYNFSLSPDALGLSKLMPSYELRLPAFFGNLPPFASRSPPSPSSAGSPFRRPASAPLTSRSSDPLSSRSTDPTCNSHPVNAEDSPAAADVGNREGLQGRLGHGGRAWRQVSPRLHSLGPEPNIAAGTSEEDFAWPFAVDDTDFAGHSSRNTLQAAEAGVGLSSSQRQHEAAVGALVVALKSAPALRVESSLLGSQRTAADALQELQYHSQLCSSMLQQRTAQSVLPLP